MQKQMVYMSRMIKYALLPMSTMFEMFGVDFMMDEKLNLYVIEANTSPMMEATTEEREKIILKMLNDMMEIIFKLLRSRMKRVIKYCNEIAKELP